jgi:ribonuclease HI
MSISTIGLQARHQPSQQQYPSPGPSIQLQQLSALSIGISCYIDAAILPDSPAIHLRKAGLGVRFVNMQGHPPNTIYIKVMLKDASTVIMAEAAALALAASIATKMEYTQVSFLTDSSQLVAFLSAADHTNPLDWQMKTYTQMFDNCAPSIHPQLYKISRNDNSMAHSLAKDALLQADTVHQPCFLNCSHEAHPSQCLLL